jgi:hypothetical protein
MDKSEDRVNMLLKELITELTNKDIEYFTARQVIFPGILKEAIVHLCAVVELLSPHELMEVTILLSSMEGKFTGRKLPLGSEIWQ